jgi:5-methylcytosine-specific restriction enzyme subunit McrC
VLRNLSIEHWAGHRSSVGFLFDMNRVFEDFLTAALTAELEQLEGRVIAQHALTLDSQTQVQMRPDLTWWLGGRCLSVMDAKYKSIAPTEMPNAHLYQMLAYCTALGVREGWLIYAAGNAQGFDATVRRTDMTIRSATVDLVQPPSDLLESVATLARRIHQSSSMEGLGTQIEINSRRSSSGLAFTDR